MIFAIENARPDHHERLSEIAHAAKRHWGYPESWIARWRETLTVTPEFIEENEVFVAIVGGEIAGFSALIKSGSKVSLEHLWIHPQYMGRGLGKELLAHALRAAARLAATSVEIESDPNAESFYKKMGARKIGETSSLLEGHERILPLLVIDTTALS